MRGLELQEYFHFLRCKRLENLVKGLPLQSICCILTVAFSTTGVMMRRQGDLSLAARIGSPVRCIASPDISFWEVMAPRQAFRRPIPGQLYHLRSHVCPGLNFPSGYRSGILLNERDARTGKMIPLTNTEVTFKGDAFGEPFFAYTCFIAISP